MCYEKGTGCAKDETEGAKFYKLAADEGHVFALYTLGKFDFRFFLFSICHLRVGL